MQPLTEPVAGQFRQGQRLEQNFQMTSGKCYSAIAAGQPNFRIVFDLLTPMPGQSPALAESKVNGQRAVLGGRGSCFKWQLPVGVNVRVRYIAENGEGAGAGRVYVK
jgi:hypothetical protein